MNASSLPRRHIFSGCTMVVFGALILFGLSSCHTTPGADKTLGWEMHRLPNAPKPYNKLLVEIDAVEGTQPDAGELAELKAWLEQMTNKPGGVTVKLDNLIAPAGARGRAPDSLALEHLNGPTDEDTAFIYVLCYRSRLNQFFAKAENPNFTFFPYPCAIFVNRSYAFGFFSLVGRARKLMMQHELGHALGLARNESHGGGGHCTNKGCLMRAAINFNLARLLTFRSPFDNADFCADCRRDLEMYKMADAPAGAQFWRGYFVRSGEGYHLLTLPGLIYVHFGDLASVDAENLAAMRRKAIVDVAVRGNCNFETHLDLADATEALCRFVERETEDEGLRDFARQIMEGITAKVEAIRDEDPEAGRAFARGVLPAAAKFPEVKARLQALCDSPEGSGPDNTARQDAGK